MYVAEQYLADLDDDDVEDQEKLLVDDSYYLVEKFSKEDKELSYKLDDNNDINITMSETLHHCCDHYQSDQKDEGCH
jgi:hypothetical protein